MAELLATLSVDGFRRCVALAVISALLSVLPASALLSVLPALLPGYATGRRAPTGRERPGCCGHLRRVRLRFGLLRHIVMRIRRSRGLRPARRGPSLSQTGPACDTETRRFQTSRGDPGPQKYGWLEFYRNTRDDPPFHRQRSCLAILCWLNWAAATATVT